MEVQNSVLHKKFFAGVIGSTWVAVYDEDIATSKPRRTAEQLLLFPSVENNLQL